MIILEGPDCSGKTTLAQFLCGKLSAHFEHIGLPPPGVRHWDIVRDKLLTCPLNTVYDRMIVGSYVFKQFKADKHNFNGVTGSELTSWQELMEALYPKALIIDCFAPYTTLLRRFKDRGDDYVTENELGLSARHYDDVWLHWAEFNNNILIFNSETMTLESFYRENLSAIELALSSTATPNAAMRNVIKNHMGDIS